MDLLIIYDISFDHKEASNPPAVNRHLQIYSVCELGTELICGR